MTVYYSITKEHLLNGTFISVHQMLQELKDEVLWFDTTHAETEIRKALQDGIIQK